MKYVGSLFSKMAAYGVALLVAYSAAHYQPLKLMGTRSRVAVLHVIYFNIHQITCKMLMLG